MTAPRADRPGRSPGVLSARQRRSQEQQSTSGRSERRARRATSVAVVALVAAFRARAASRAGRGQVPAPTPTTIGASDPRPSPELVHGLPVSGRTGTLARRFAYHQRARAPGASRGRCRTLWLPRAVGLVRSSNGAPRRASATTTMSGSSIGSDRDRVLEAEHARAEDRRGCSPRSGSATQRPVVVGIGSAPATVPTTACRTKFEACRARIDASRGSDGKVRRRGSPRRPASAANL